MKQGKTTLHTLWVANDNDFLTEVPDDNGRLTPNPNQFFVFGFTDADLAGSNWCRNSSDRSAGKRVFRKSTNRRNKGAPFLAHVAGSGDATCSLKDSEA